MKVTLSWPSSIVNLFVKNIMLKIITTIVEISPGGVASLSEFYETLNFGPNANISSLLFSYSKLKRMVK